MPGKGEFWNTTGHYFSVPSEDAIRPPSEWPHGCQTCPRQPVCSPPVPAEPTTWVWGRVSSGAPLEQSHIPGSCRTRLGPPGAGGTERVCAGLRRAVECSHPYSAKYHSGQVPRALQNIPVFIYINALLKKDPTCFPWQMWV